MSAEYLVTSAQLCVPLSKQVDMEQGATTPVNPLTDWALMEEARLDRHRAVVQTAAASALGRMLVRLARRFSIPIISVVRRAEQVELLRKMGAEYVLNTSGADFDASLEDLCHKLGATIGFDGVAGEISARVYGRSLAGVACSFIAYEDRTHLDLAKDTPAWRLAAIPSAVESNIRSFPRLGGLHHRYDLAA